jgi:hypothetical protein
MLRPLILYYGILQSVHLLALLRAGYLFSRLNRFPFPAPPPAGGWAPQTVPFLIGMGIVDAVAIILALIFAFTWVTRRKIQTRLGLISLTIAGASAAIFAIGTFASGAWAANPLAYGVMVILFAPLLPFFVLLARA